MGLKVGNYSFPEDLLDDRAKLLALISLVAQRLNISQAEWDRALEEAYSELLRQDPDLKLETIEPVLEATPSEVSSRPQRMGRSR